jgi:hypothetical protein
MATKEMMDRIVDYIDLRVATDAFFFPKVRWLDY